MGTIVAAGKSFIPATVQSLASKGKSWFSAGGKEVTQAPLQKKDVAYSAFSLFMESTKAQLKNYCKVVNYSAFWANRVLTQPSFALEVVGKDMGHFKNCVSVFDLFKKSPELTAQVAALYAAPSAAAVTGLVTKSSDLFNSFADVASAVNRYVPVDGIRTISNVNAGATLIFAASKVKENCSKLLKAQTDQQKMLYVMNLVSALSYVTFGVISLTALAMGTVASLPALITCLTTGTMLALMAFFYEKVYDPEKKNENVDFAALKTRIQLA